MSTPILATKLYIPPPPPKVVLRPRLTERLNEGLHRKVTLISAPAGFGKTTLVSAWIASLNSSTPVTRYPTPTPHASDGTPHSFKVAWLSLDEGESDPARFLTYVITALRTVAPTIGEGVLGVLQSPAPAPPPTEPILTTLLNEITTLSDTCVLVLDDYHVIDARAIDDALTFLIEHLPPQMRLVIATREDPQLPLARLRAGDQLAELRVTDLRFTPVEAAEFLNQAMGLQLSAEEIAALESRTEGWIAGLQLAAISMQGYKDTTEFVKSFTGSHRFVMDYLVEEVLQQQPEPVQTFLLRTSILDRLCGPLCDAVLIDPSAPGQEALEYLERTNLFIIPLDNERRWYRYHHLFADLLRQRLHQSTDERRRTKDEGRNADSSSFVLRPSSFVDELHIRASQWYEENGLDIEAFQHAAAANDIDRAERLMDGRGIPLHFRGAVTTIVNWLESLPAVVKNARPSLWWRHGAMLLVIGHTTGVEEKLDAAEAALQKLALSKPLALSEANGLPNGTEADEKAQYLVGRIAAARAVLALTRYDVEAMLTQSRRALEFLPPNNRTLRANAHWTLGYAYFLLGDRAAARQALTEAIALSQASGDIFTGILATTGLGNVQEADNELFQAAETYRRVLQVSGDQPLQIIYEAHLGLARVLYEWNELDAAEEHGQQSLQLARQYDKVIDRFIVCELFLARVKLARGDEDGAADMLVQANQSARQRNFVHRLPEVAAAQVPILLRRGHVPEAARLAQTYNLPLSMARVHLAQGDTSSALAVLESFRQSVEAKGWKDEGLKAMVLQSVVLHAHGELEKAVEALGEALALAEPGGFVRIFVDEGIPMARLLAEAARRGIMRAYASTLIAALDAEKQRSAGESTLRPVAASQPLVEPLSQRELEVLQLIAQGLSNSEISERLFLALDTVKGHNRRIFDKLHVQRRTEAIARARQLGLL
jgi:LuxR family maltose regulon positive regulatory protein